MARIDDDDEDDDGSGSDDSNADDDANEAPPAKKPRLSTTKVRFSSPIVQRPVITLFTQGRAASVESVTSSAPAKHTVRPTVASLIN